MLLPGLITILCHAGALFPYEVMDGGFNTVSYLERRVPAEDFAVVNYLSLTDLTAYRGPAPIAEDDFASTQEETPITFDILSNDKKGSSGDDDDDDDDSDFRIDRSSVDLDPDRTGRQSSRSEKEGAYTVDKNGYVTFHPAVNFFGNASIQYSVDSKAGETSNRATISLSVANVNDAPIVGGWRQGPPQAVAGKPVAITPDDVIVNDPDNHSSEDFTLRILPGDDYTVSGNTVTPHANVSGNIAVHVQVHDGFTDSEASALSLQVTQENAVPVITGQN